MPEVFLIVGARPNFVKAAPVHRALTRLTGVEATLVHTGQHYDSKMSDVVFEDLGLPAPDIHLEIGSGSHAEQTAAVMRRLEPLLLKRSPDLVIVFGDINSTMAAAVTSAKLRISVAHVEAGLRSFNPDMPEELNRRITDCVSDLLFTTEPSANENLAREGVPEEKVHFVGNTMVDSLLYSLPAARQRRSLVLGSLGLGGVSTYGVLTLHRPSNVDEEGDLSRLLDAVRRISSRLPIIFPAHPRTLARLADERADRHEGLKIVEPLGYLDFLSLLAGARLVLTDSGGIQEETTALGVPCLTLRHDTERPVTITEGTNSLVGTAAAEIVSCAMEELDRTEPCQARERPRLWDGKAAERIASVLGSWFVAGANPPHRE